MKNQVNILDIELEDDDTLFGGVAFSGETVRDFLDSFEEEDRPHDIDELNKKLVECGIKPIHVELSFMDA